MKMQGTMLLSGVPRECNCPAETCAPLAAQCQRMADSEVCSQDCGHSRVKLTCLLIREISHLDILGGLGDPLLNGTFLFSSQRCVVLVNILDAAADASATLQVQL